MCILVRLMNKGRRIWLTTDTHFNHRKMIEKGFRPHDFEAQIIMNWNRLVNPCDIVVHLGDVIVGRERELMFYNESLNGVKTLVRGNHDQGRTFSFYIDHGFAMVCDALRFDDVLLTHEPTRESPVGSEWTMNIHGHLHADGHRNAEFDLKPHHALLALEETNYCPVELQVFAELHRKRLLKQPSAI